MFTITGKTSGTYVTFEVCSGVAFNTGRTVNTYVFTDDTADILDEGKNIDQIVVTGVDDDTFGYAFPIGTIYGRAKIINDFMDDQEEIELTGMNDNNLNTDYIVKDFSFNAKAGCPYIYDFTITLERLRDRLPYSEL